MSQIQLEKKSSPALKLIPIVLVVLVLASVGGYFFFKKKYEEKAINSFSIFMNHCFEPDGWKAESYDFSFSDKKLTANNVTLNPAKLDLPSSSSVKIANVEIVNSLLGDDLTNLLNLTSWQSKTDTHLADQVTLNKTEISVKEVNFEATGKIDQINFSGLDLVAAVDDSTGPLSFIKNARMGLITTDNIQVDVKQADSSFNFHITRVETSDYRMAQNVKSLDDIIGLIGSYKVKESTLQDLSFKYENTKKEDLVNFKLGHQELKDVDDFKFNYLNWKDFAFEIQNKELGLPLTASFADFTVDKLDFKPFIDRLTEVTEKITSGETQINDIDSVYSAYSKLYRLSDIFAMPYSFNEISLSQAKAAFSDVVMVGLDFVQVKGPFVANQVAPSSSFVLNGLHIKLPEQTDQPKLQEIAQFVKDFGQNSFDLSYNINNSYDPNTGSLKHSYKPMILADNLVTLNVDFALANLTPSLVAKMNAVALDETENLLFEPELQVLGLSSIRLEIIDNSLTDKIIKYIALKDGSEFELTKSEIIASIGLLEQNLAEHFETSHELASGLSTFIEKPGSLVLEIAAEEPLSMAFCLSKGFDGPTIVNSLNGTLTVNNQEALPIIMHPTKPAGAQEEPDFNFDDDESESESQE
jgi:hypothetical protein